jgi:hypothetical protein
MIVRSQGDRFILIKQLDHSLVSGVFSVYWKETIAPLSQMIHTISYHDVGWVTLDQSVLWDDEKDKPIDFADYPLEPKIEAYRHGISLMEKQDPYAGYLCSMHFASFFKNEQSGIGLTFLMEEKARQERLWEKLTQREKEKATDNYALLKFFDDLSLSLCLNEPMENTHPWFSEGIYYQNRRYQWIWEDDKHLLLEPNGFARPFTIHIPYKMVNQDREVLKEDVFIYHIEV